MDTPRTTYKIDANSPGTEAAAEAAAALSAASIVFKKIDINYSSKLLSQSKSVSNSNNMFYFHSWIMMINRVYDPYLSDVDNNISTLIIYLV